MSYSPTTWESGDTITSAKLNKLEHGVASAGGGGVLIVTETNGTLDKTWQEIHDATFAVVVAGDSREPVIISTFFESTYVVACVGDPDGGGLTEISYIATSADGYPALQT